MASEIHNTVSCSAKGRKLEKMGNYSGPPLAPPAAAREKERFSRGHPLYPAKGRVPLGTPLKLTFMGDPPIGVNLRATPFHKGCWENPAGVWGVSPCTPPRGDCPLEPRLS